jgi:hypothetical protein
MKKTHNRFFVMSFALSALGIVVAGYFYLYIRKKLQDRSRTFAYLCRRFENRRMIQWRRERLGDGFVLYRNKEFARLTERVAEQPGDVDARTSVNGLVWKLCGAPIPTKT